MTTITPTDVPTGRRTARRSARTDHRRMDLSGPLAILLLGGLVVVPLVFIVLASFIDGTPVAGSQADFTPRAGNFTALVSGGTLEALRNSLVVGILGSAVAVAIGGALAWLAARTDVPLRSLVSISGVVPIFIPSLVGAVAWSQLASPDIGYLSLASDAMGIGWHPNVESLPGMVFVFATYNVPYAFIFINNALGLMNAELEEAAAVHGAGKLRVALGTSIPLAKPALLSAALLIFVLIIEDFPISMILGFGNGVQTLSSRVYILMSQAPPRANVASALGVLLLVLTIALVVLQRRLLRGQSFATVTGKGLKGTPVRLGRWRWPAVAFVALYLFVAAVLPMAALLVAALRTQLFTPDFGALFDTASISTATLRDSLADADVQAAAINTIIVGALTAVLGIALCYFLAHVVHTRAGSGLAKVISTLAVLPAAVPGVVLGLGMLWAFTSVPMLYGTLVILVLAFVARFIPQGISNMSSAMERIHPDLEESATVSGAGRFRATMWVTFPLLRASVFSTGLLMFVLSMRELSASIFLYTPQTKTLSIEVFNLWSNGSTGAVAAISLVYSLFLLVIVVAGRRWLNSAR